VAFSKEGSHNFLVQRMSVFIPPMFLHCQCSLELVEGEMKDKIYAMEESSNSIMSRNLQSALIVK
jgi:hypothetical protein